jgi:predicted dinucleotide-binding enzyme
MRIAIIGSGSVGGSLARGWAEHGHTITFGARNLGDDRLRRLVEELGGAAQAASIAVAVEEAEVVVLATPWAATLDIARGLDLKGKTVVDSTNPLAPNLSGLTVGGNDSGAEQIARAAPGARVVKCFNTTGANNFLAPNYPGGPATMMFCGDDSESKGAVRQLGLDLGFDMVDLGPLNRARLLEPFALLWITLAYPQGMGRDIAFRLERRGP